VVRSKVRLESTNKPETLDISPYEIIFRTWVAKQGDGWLNRDIEWLRMEKWVAKRERWLNRVRRVQQF
jgi:hypothetical protein